MSGEQALIKAPMKPVRAPVVMLKVVGQESAKVPVKAPVIVQTKAPVRAPVVMPLKAPPKAKAMQMHQPKADLKIIREVVLWKEGPKVKGGKGDGQKMAQKGQGKMMEQQCEGKGKLSQEKLNALLKKENEKKSEQAKTEEKAMEVEKKDESRYHEHHIDILEGRVEEAIMRKGNETVQDEMDELEIEADDEEMPDAQQ